MALTTQFRQDFQMMLKQENAIPYNELLMNLLICLEKHTLLDEREICASKMLVHHKNRNGLMLSVHNAHANAATIVKVGADRSQLSNAVCIELATEGHAREINIQKNKALVARAKGKLAPVTGEEKYLSVGCGHTAAFVKLAKVGGPTPEASLADEKGMIDVGKLKRNPEFKVMIEKGWSWKVVPAIVDHEFPNFAGIAQKALNVNNHVAQKTSELEMALSMTELVSDPAINEGEADWKSMVVENMKDRGIPSGEYADIILEFALEYGGGKDGSEIKFMHDVACHFGCSNVLGESFWTAVTKTVFADRTSMFPLLRVALCLCNLSAEQVQDGIGKLLMKSDVAKLASKACSAKAKACEETLVKAKAIIATLSEQYEDLDENACLEPLGKIFVRVGLYGTDKGKAGRENKQYSLQEIKQLFLDELTKIVGKQVNYTPWSVEGKKEAEAPSTESQCVCEVATLEDHSKPLWIAQKAGFDIGKSIYERLDKAVTIERVFDIVSIDDDKNVKLVAKCAYDGVHKTGEISLDCLLAKWAVSKMEAPVCLKIAMQKPPSLDMEHQKCLIFNAIYEAHSSAAGDSLQLWRKPDMVRTSGASISVGALTLVPMVSMTGIVTKECLGSVSIGKFAVGGKTTEFFITPPPKPVPPPEDPLKYADTAIASPFWWVSTTSTKAVANMEHGVKTVKGIDIPVLKNKVALPPYTSLCKFVPAKAAMESSIELETGAPKKKARK